MPASARIQALDRRVWDAQSDAGQLQGRLRERHGGGATEMPGIRLMASGLPHRQWNNGDVNEPERVPWDEVRAWYAARAGGAGVPWGVRVPIDQSLDRGRRLFRKRCMALPAADFRPVSAPDRVTLRRVDLADVAVVTRIDAEAFGESSELTRRWIEPSLEAADVSVTLALFDGEPVGIATAVRSNGRAGACVGVYGVGVDTAVRGRGIGGAITSWLLDRAFRSGASLAHLNPDSDAAARLYARLGFVETAGIDIYVDV
ncbi:MAG TPA: GNAT family N-acetyltransferase [Burkholderiaceae bacterium]|nr:GNAT family N-acetyltransferase [Burkholderiaceae bacterium]